MNFDLEPALAELRNEIRAFVDERVIPAESVVIEEDQRQDHTTLHALQEEAKELGLWAPHLPTEYGGRGLGIMGMCALFREMGRSPIGCRVFNCDAPDQGNMDLLLRSASDAVKERWLAPLCAGEITSGFSMTEPAPGAGADPSNLRTEAREDGDHWVINGHKWYTTGGGEAGFLIVMARTSDDPRQGASMFVVDRHQDGVVHVRDIPTLAEELLTHREAEIRFDDVRVGPEAILGQIGEGFRLAQQRLVPARLTHCMRWLGLADRALDMCKAYLGERQSFGRSLSEHQLIQAKIARAATAIHAGNLMTLHCASVLEQGLDKAARPYSSMAKTHIAQALCQLLDDAIQMHGGLGFSQDLPFGSWYRHARAGRIVDGPDEVHTMLIAREYLRGRINLLV